MLERDVFVGDFGAGAGTELLGGSGIVAEVVPTATARGSGTGARTGGHAIAAAPEHAEIVGDDFEAGALLAFLILPLAGLNASFDENQGAFFEILLGDFGLLAPNDDLVPFGALLALAVAVFVGFVGGDGEIGNGLPAGGIASFRIAAQAANENDFIDGHRAAPWKRENRYRHPEKTKITRGRRKAKCGEEERNGCGRVVPGKKGRSREVAVDGTGLP